MNANWHVVQSIQCWVKYPNGSFLFIISDFHKVYREFPKFVFTELLLLW